MTDDQVTILARRWVDLQREARAIEAALEELGIELIQKKAGVSWWEGCGPMHDVSGPLADA